MFIDRDGNGKISGRFLVEQRPGQEQIADNAAEVLLQDGKSAKLLAVGDAFADAQTFVFNGVAYQVDAASQQRITSWGALALGVVANVPGLTWPANFVWVAADNSHQSFATAAAFLAFAQSAAVHVTALILTARALKDATIAAADLPTLATIDPTTLTKLA